MTSIIIATGIALIIGFIIGAQLGFIGGHKVARDEAIETAMKFAATLLSTSKNSFIDIAATEEDDCERL